MRRVVKGLKGAGVLFAGGKQIDVDYTIAVWGDANSRGADGLISGLDDHVAFAILTETDEFTLQLQDGTELECLSRKLQAGTLAFAVNTPIE